MTPIVYNVWRIAAEKALPGKEILATQHHAGHAIPGDSPFCAFMGQFVAATEREAIRQALNSKVSAK